ncbi:MAG: c-type cytochrome [Epsilonproteobacteria bacterium]|nr:cytochrome C [Campylobacterota bacterium]NPA56436.1 c-type cytochrome [Campylobacterota bacterium]
MKKWAVLTLAVATATTLMAADGAALYKKCAGCHGAHGEKKALGKSAIIKDMTKDEVYKALQDYKAGKRNTHGMGALMKGQVANMSDADMKAIADYIGK